MTTSADRLLLRWVPLAAFLAVVMAVSLTAGPQPFGFHGWPKAPAPRSIDRVVRVTPADSRVALASREPAPSPKPAHRAATADRVAALPAPTRRHVEHVARAPRHSGRHGSARGAGQDRSPAPVESPAPRTHHGDTADQTPDGTPLAQAPRPLPRGAHAKPQVRPAGPLHRHGHGHAYGRKGGPGRHGHH
ncbi:MAG: hypothetical protein ACJ760_06835 [Thermoleophilaceae bacterium]